MPIRYKPEPGSTESRVVELLRFLPEGTALSTSDLCRRIEGRPKCGMTPTMSAAVSRGLVKFERRRNLDGPGNALFWMAGDDRPSPSSRT